MNDEFRLIGRRLPLEWNASFSRKHVQESSLGIDEPRFLVPFEGNAEAAVDGKLTLALRDMCGLGHQRE
jgi:hypothetical protein